MKTYLIPHNYKNNGRVMNLFYTKNIVAALAWLVPATLLAIAIPGAFLVKLFIYILAAVPPPLLILMGYGEWVVNVLRFMTNRRVYYNVRKGEATAYAYQRLKAAAAATGKTGGNA